jgi:predicted aldo/keto reductase-like oxidoreductase
VKNKSNYPPEITRRGFLKVMGVLTAMAYLPSCAQTPRSDRWGPVLPTRRLGKTGLDVTIFCVGGGPAAINLPEQESILEAALSGGCRFFETARSYARGESELAFGRFLKQYRNEIFLSSKSRSMDADNLKRELDESLEALKTSYLDIYLMHNMDTIENVNIKLENGVYDAMLKAKEEGKVRHLGFTGHADPAVNNYVMNLNLPELEVMLVPVNVIDPVYNSFITNTLPVAVEKNIGVMAMKPLGGGAMLGHDVSWGKGRGNTRPRVIPELITMQEAQHFVYSMPISTASFGCTSVEEVKENISLAKSFSSMNIEEQADLIKKVTKIAKSGILEHYKT